MTTTVNPNALNFIFGRRSVRVYSPGDVSETIVKQLLETAMAAPSAMTKDPWRFVVVRDRSALARLANVLPGGKMLSTATLAIVVCGDLDAAFERNLSYLLQDCSAAIENLLLAAHALGLGACWVGVHPLEDALRQVRGMLSLPGSFLPIAVISLGQPGESPEPRTRYNPDYVRRETW
ncbi:MAG TPA: nitroreductase family protein [Verrucomicrobiae bacterium]